MTQVMLYKVAQAKKGALSHATTYVSLRAIVWNFAEQRECGREISYFRAT